MSRFAPKPKISQTLGKWTVEPGMTFATVLDDEQRVWVEESCPLGAIYWTLDQAVQLPAGHRTRVALTQAIDLGCEHLSLDRMPTLPKFEERRSVRRQIAANPGDRLARV